MFIVYNRYSERIIYVLIISLKFGVVKTLNKGLFTHYLAESGPTFGWAQLKYRSI